jgi:hypothetical protein
VGGERNVIDHFTLFCDGLLLLVTATRQAATFEG